MTIFYFRLLWLIFNVSLPIAVIYGIYYQLWGWLLAMLLMIPIIGGGLGIAIAMHRYLSHRSFGTTKTKHIILSLLAFLSGQGSSVTWSMIHRHHHVHSDQEKDVHSPKHGLLAAGVKWIVQDYTYYKNKAVKANVKDLLNDPINLFLHQHYYILWFGIILVGAILNFNALLFLLLAPIGKGYLDAALTNTIGHIKIWGSYRNFETADNSQNVRWYSYFCLGEGMHNNHHARPSDYNQNLFPGDVDLAGKFIDKFLVEHSSQKIHNF